MQRFKQFQVLLLSVLVLGFAPGCDDDDDDGGGGTTNSTLTATVNNVEYTFETTVANPNGVGGIVVAANDLNVDAGRTRAISLILFSTEVGEYSMNPAAMQVTGSYADAELTSGEVWGATIGTLTITESSANNVKGTFNFTGENQQDGSIRIVTNGSFDLNF